jgi:hypothetical protein
LAGDFKTQAGNISTRLVYLPDGNQASHFEGTVQTQSFNLTRLLDSRYQPGNISFNLAIQADQPMNAPLKGSVNGEISQLVLAGYTYSNLTVQAQFDNQQASGIMMLADEHAHLSWMEKSALIRQSLSSRLLFKSMTWI